MIKVNFLSLEQQWNQIRDEALFEIDQILKTGKYIDHELIYELEIELAKKLSVKKTLLVNSGTDALILSLKSLGIGKGDEVITVPNSFIATAAAIHHIGAKCIFVDVNKKHLMDKNLIQDLITKKTKAILPVHLEGKVCEMDDILEIAKLNSLYVIEDAAQSFGSKYKMKPSGSFGDFGCFSLHPLKNLNACGDGGLISTNNEFLLEEINKYRNHGQFERNNSDEFGVVSRFDSLQAGILKVKLKYFEQHIEKRRENAKLYFEHLDSNYINLPEVDENVYHTFHLFVIEVENRNELMTYLASNGIETKIHYPNLIVDQPVYLNQFNSKEQFKMADYQKNRILSLPVHQFLTKTDIVYVSDTINNFYRKELRVEN